MLSVTPPGRAEPTTGFAPACSALRERRLSQSSHVGMTGAAGVEPASSALEADLLPLEPHPREGQRHQGVRGESNPPLRRSQRRVRHRYTTDTINRAEGAGVEPTGPFVGPAA